MRGTVRGTVTTAAGRPVAEASVMISASELPHQDLAFLTDAQGGYRLPSLEPGRYTILVEAGRARQTREALVRAGEETRLDFTLPR